MPSISPQKRHGKIVGYSVYLGSVGNEHRVRRFFPQRRAAERFLAQQTTTPVPVGELWERKAELLYALERLRPLNTNLHDAITFYLTHQGSPTGEKLWSQVVESFLSEKLRIGRSPQYDRNMRQSLSRFISITGGDRSIGTITRQQITDYVYRTNADLSPVSKANILRNLNVLFRYAIKEEWLTKNPVEKITRPIIPFRKPHILAPTDFSRILHRCLKRQWHDRLVVLVLVGFCGIRTEEACRLSWKHLHLDSGIVELPADFAKKARFRNNRIPPNAMEWLRHVQDRRRKGRIIGPNWRNLLRSAVQLPSVDYRHNCLRHSFCSYALAGGWSLADVIAAMGHAGSPAVIFAHYRNVVAETDGKSWFALTP
jgi:site-specific recombinase XerD